jgi:hypothetical protein
MPTDMEVIPSRKISISIGDRHKHLSPALLIRSCTLNLGMLLTGSQIAHQSRVGVLRSRWFDHRSRSMVQTEAVSNEAASSNVTISMASG